MERRREVKQASIVRQKNRMAAKRKLIDHEIEELPSIFSQEPLSKLPKIELEINVDKKLNLSAVNQSTKEDLLEILPKTICLVKTRPTNSTFKKYIDRVLIARRLIGKANGYDFLLNTDEVIGALCKEYPVVSSRSTIATALTAFCGRISGLEIPYSVYGNYATSLKNEIRKKLEKNELSDKQKLCWLSWIEIISLLPSISTMSARDKLIYALYTENPPRRVRDYSELMIFISDLETVDISIIPEDKNYLIFNNLLQPIGFSITNFKTSKTYGTFRRIVTKNSKLYDRIVEYVGPNPRHNSFLFCNRNDECCAGEVFSTIVGNMFEKATLQILGKKVRATVNTLRHSYVTYVVENHLFKTVELRTQIGLEMGQSLNQSLLYVKYID